MASSESGSAGGDGRRADFTEFVAANGDRYLRTAYLLTGDRGAAEDLLQEVLERTYVAWPRIREPHGYLRTALVHRATTRWRLRSRRGEVPLLDTVHPPVEDGAGQRADRAAVVDALRQLPARQRATVVLRFFDDLTEAQTAAALGCSIGTVKSQTSKALASLRHLMSDPSPRAAQLGDAVGEGSQA